MKGKDRKETSVIFAVDNAAKIPKANRFSFFCEFTGSCEYALRGEKKIRVTFKFRIVLSAALRHFLHPVTKPERLLHKK